MNPLSARPVPDSLPALLAPLHRRVSAWVERLPTAPPSWLAARVLDRVLLQRLPTDARTALDGRCVELCVSDFGLRVRLKLTPDGFTPAGGQGDAALRIAATGTSYLRLLRGRPRPQRADGVERVLQHQAELGVAFHHQHALEEQTVGIILAAPRR